MSEVGADRVELYFEPTEPFQVVDWYSDDGTVYEMVGIHIPTEDGEPIAFHWQNTILRYFPRQDTANHVDYKDENGKVQGYLVSPELWQAMREHGFPVLEWQIVDPTSAAWLGRVSARQLEEELDHLEDFDE